jgi:hypothetical protein
VNGWDWRYGGSGSADIIAAGRLKGDQSLRISGGSSFFAQGNAFVGQTLDDGHSFCHYIKIEQQGGALGMGTGVFQPMGTEPMSVTWMPNGDVVMNRDDGNFTLGTYTVGNLYFVEYIVDSFGGRRWTARITDVTNWGDPPLTGTGPWYSLSPSTDPADWVTGASWKLGPLRTDFDFVVDDFGLNTEPVAIPAASAGTVFLCR